MLSGILYIFLLSFNLYGFYKWKKNLKPTFEIVLMQSTEITCGFPSAVHAKILVLSSELSPLSVT